MTQGGSKSVAESMQSLEFAKVTGVTVAPGETTFSVSTNLFVSWMNAENEASSGIVIAEASRARAGAETCNSASARTSDRMK